MKKGNTSPWQAWIFDLDDTLLDTSGLLIPMARKRAFQCLVEEGAMPSLDDCEKQWALLREHYSGEKLLAQIIENSRSPSHPSTDSSSNSTSLSLSYSTSTSSTSLSASASTSPSPFKPSGSDTSELSPFKSTITSSPQIEALAKKAYLVFRSSPLPAFLPLQTGAKEILKAVKDQFPLYLVTQGDIESQIKKTQALELHLYFTHMYFVDPMTGETKTQAFQSILEKGPYNPKKVLSIGNRLDAEIALSKRLGITTCYVRYGEHSHEKPQTQEEFPDFEIQKLEELHSLFSLLKGGQTRHD